MTVHVHGWVRCRYGVRRCAGPDCTAWLPPQPTREGAHGCLLPFGKPRRPGRAGKGAAITAAPNPSHSARRVPVSTPDVKESV